MQITIDLPDNLPLTEADVRIKLTIGLDRLFVEQASYLLLTMVQLVVLIRLEISDNLS
jgi:hypothetical protein